MSVFDHRDRAPTLVELDAGQLERMRRREQFRPSEPFVLRPERCRPVRVPPIDASRIAVHGVSVHVRAAPDGHGLEIDVALHVPDRDTGRPTKVRTTAAIAYEALEEALSREQVHDAVYDAVRRAIIDGVSHEVEELLRVEGRCWVDPHVAYRAEEP